MKSVLFLVALSAFSAVQCGSASSQKCRQSYGDSYVQNSSGNATFTVYTGCNEPACGKVSYGYTAAINQLAFGAAGGQGGGDACGRCFKLTATKDPYSPWAQDAFKSIVVKVTDLCPYAENEDWCGQSVSKPLNQFGASVHFDLCKDSGAYDAFFPSGLGALSGDYEEVPCSQWSGWDGPALWNGACLASESVDLWPSVGCGNTGQPPA